MDSIPDEILWGIFCLLKQSIDRSSAMLAYKKLYVLYNQRKVTLRVGVRFHPFNSRIASLVDRFYNLKVLEISYAGWVFSDGKQLDDEGLSIISNGCRLLAHITLSYCTFITDLGLGHLSAGSNLLSLKMDFVPRISGCGVLSVVIGCKSLIRLHLAQCLSITNFEWLEQLGRIGIIEDLEIRKCRAIGEGDLIKLGQSWKSLRRLNFEVDYDYRYMKFYDPSAVDRWQKQLVSCECLQELSLVNCVNRAGRGLACVFSECQNLKKIDLHLCIGVTDDDIVVLSQKSKKLGSICLEFPCELMNNAPGITDRSLDALARNCHLLESVKLSFCGECFPSYPIFTVKGVTEIIQRCPVKQISLDYIKGLDDEGMRPFYGKDLEMVELVRCQEVSDEGLKVLWNSPKLKTLKLKCLRITDGGLNFTHKLDLLAVVECPRVSKLRAVEVASCASIDGHQLAA